MATAAVTTAILSQLLLQLSPLLLLLLLLLPSLPLSLSLPFMSAAVPLEMQFVSHSLVCLLTCLFACSLVYSLSPYKHVLPPRRLSSGRHHVATKALVRSLLARVDWLWISDRWLHSWHYQLRRWSL